MLITFVFDIPRKISWQKNLLCVSYIAGNIFDQERAVSRFLKNTVFLEILVLLAVTTLLPRCKLVATEEARSRIIVCKNVIFARDEQHFFFFYEIHFSIEMHVVFLIYLARTCKNDLIIFPRFLNHRC